MARQTHRQRIQAQIAECVLRLRSAASTTRQLHRSHHEHIVDTARGVYNTPAYQRLPRWARSYIQGVDHQLFHELQQAAEYRQRLDGVYVPASQITSEHYAQGRVALEVGTCFWPGTDRPW